MKKLAGSFAAVCIAATSIIGASAANAAPTTVTASCYSGQVKVGSWTRADSSYASPWRSPVYTTSTRCGDINARTNMPIGSYRIRWVDAGYTSARKYPTTRNLYTWQAFATDVNNYARFQIVLEGENIQASNPNNRGSMYVAF